MAPELRCNGMLNRMQDFRSSEPWLPLTEDWTARNVETLKKDDTIDVQSLSSVDRSKASL